MTEEIKTGNEAIAEFHVFVTSNASRTHIIFGNHTHTACGIENEPIGKVWCRFPSSEIRSTYPKKEFIKWFKSQENVESEFGFCKKCRKKFINWYTSNKK
jgi:hypothetical protein